MTREPVKSSNIAAIGYDPAAQVMEVEFKGSGKVYRYADVPEKNYRELMAADSIGSHFSKHCRSAFCCECVDEKAAAGEPSLE